MSRPLDSARQPEPSALVLNEPRCYHFRVLDPRLPLRVRVADVLKRMRSFRTRSRLMLPPADGSLVGEIIQLVNRFDLALPDGRTFRTRAPTSTSSTTR